MTVLRDINITLKDHILPKIPEFEGDSKSIVFDSPAEINPS